MLTKAKHYMRNGAAYTHTLITDNTTTQPPHSCDFSIHIKHVLVSAE